jgi:uncharacterized protein
MATGDLAERRAQLLARRRALESLWGAYRPSQRNWLRRQLTRSQKFVLNAGLVLTGLHWHVRRNARRPVLHEITLRCPLLPPELAGMRILHLSDLHMPPESRLAGRVPALVAGLRPDLCVFTGDFYHIRRGPHDHVYGVIRRLVEAAGARLGNYAVLGNHDLADAIDPLAAAGVRVLMNEGMLLEHNGAAFWLAGVDDPHDFRTDDLGLALAGQPAGLFTVLLAHSPELADEAASAGCGAYLCGHTHGGQLRLPWIGAPLLNARAPRSRCAGAWVAGNMAGYTTNGLGTTLLPVRLNCPAEAALITLARAD